LGRVSGGGFIRVTIDSDSNSRLSLLWKIFKGFILCRKFPDEIRKTSKGYHLIWYGLKIDFKKHFVYRKFIGDDPHRILLDMNPKRIGQVLFTSKMVLVKKNGGTWEKMKHCKICGMPLTLFWVYKYDDYYCIKCGVQNVKLLERINRVRDEQLFKLIIFLITHTRQNN
jgi:hypothetical protein